MKYDMFPLAGAEFYSMSTQVARLKFTNRDKQSCCSIYQQETASKALFLENCIVLIRE
jgi:hypothetical protein